MAGQLFDIGGLFADILADPKAEKAKDLEYRKGLFGDGSGIGGSLRGMLAEGSQNFNTGVRRGVQQAGTAINPDFDIRTAPDKYRAVVNAINPAAADAEQQYIEATKQYAPNKLPQLMQNIKKNKREEAAESRREQESKLALKADARAEKVVDLDRERFEEQRERNDWLNLASFNANADYETKQEALQAATQYLLSSEKAKNNPRYAQEVAGMSESQKLAAVKALSEQESAANTRLGNMIKANLPEDSELLEYVGDMPFAAKQTLLNNITGAELADEKYTITSGVNGVWAIPSDPRKAVMVSPPAVEVQRAAKITPQEGEGMVERIENRPGMTEALEVYLNDGARLNDEIPTLVRIAQEKLWDAGKVGTMQQVEDEVVRMIRVEKQATQESTAALGESVISAQARLDAFNRQVPNPGTVPSQPPAASGRRSGRSTIPPVAPVDALQERFDMIKKVQPGLTDAQINSMIGR